MDSENGTRHNTQKLMAFRLRAVAIAVGILGGIFFAAVLSVRGFLTWDILGNDRPEEYWTDAVKVFSAAHFAFTIAAAICCYRILYLFWRVTGEIGRDNSFSPENVSYFRKMSRTGWFIVIIYAARCAILFLNIRSGFPLYRYFAGWHRLDAAVGDAIGIAYSVIMAIAFALFSVLADVLSKLIANAYEVKSENDLTI